jgi:hypothetical protein
MKTAFAIAVLLSATALGGAANAREMGRMERPTGNVHVIYQNYNDDEGLPNDESITPSDAVTAQAQSEIRHEPGLRAALLAKDVELRNVIEIDKDGSNTMVYVR